MIKLKVNLKNHYIPQTWDEITLGTFLQLKEFERMKDVLEALDYNIKYVSIFSSISVDELYTIPVDELKNLMNLAYLLMNSEIPNYENPTIVIDGVEYGLDKDVKNISFGQFVDCEMLLKDSDFWEVSNKLTAIFFRRKKMKKGLLNKLKSKIFNQSAEIEPYDFSNSVVDSEIFYDKLPVSYIHSIMGFFLTLGHHLLNNIKDSSLQAESKKVKIVGLVNQVEEI